MCGIAGWYRRGGKPVPADAITAQCDSIVSRGPDDSGVMVDRDFGFGMRRLSILDIAGGHQPMGSPDGRFAIVFNGEIFNHQDLRTPLTAAGYRFTSHSDTETILAAYAVWGNEAWARLEGMFAVAIWDRATRSLTLARDPIGIKPLYVSQQNGGVSFASELKALRVLPNHEFSINQRAVHDFFSFGHVRKPRSIFNEVTTLAPGSFMTVPAVGDTTVAAYWSPRLDVIEGRSDAEWIADMQEMLLATTARHLQSDVPVGAFLSGGIDSSAILAAMVRSTDRPIKAFTVGYPGAKVDESAAAAEIASHLGCEHIVLSLEPKDAIASLPEVLRYYDEPFADMAALPTWQASRLAAEHVKVVLCGEGGDELFAGYKRHRNAGAIERMRPLIRAMGPLVAMIDRIPATSSRRFNYLRQHAQRFGEFIRLPDGYQQFFAATQISRGAVRNNLLSADLRRNFEQLDSYALLEAEYFPAQASAPGPSVQSALERFMLADLTLNMPSAMLTRLDRASMAHSLEARVPLLSHRMVDWALTVPEKMKLRGNTGKYLLRQAIEPWLPPGLTKRPKQGFQIPHAHWLRGPLGDFAQDAWTGSGAASSGYLDPQAVSRLFEEHRRGTADHGRMLFAIAGFAVWWQNNSASPAKAGVPAC